uniref:ARAD1D23034p n=1 Tax=Blastobotrys adeninivorans TaxID=409370 RepID=A0A060TAV4_BLAAD
MAGSQLKKLRESLKANGVIGPSDSKKKNERNKRKRKEAISSIREQVNPFDIKVNRQKQHVFGQNTQGSMGRPALAKQQREEARMKAFKSEQARKNKVGGILDRRFGENDATMTPEEKMLARFTRERQARVSKNSLFNLEDDDDEATLAPYGQSLSLADDFEAEDGDMSMSDEELQEIRRKRNKLALDAAEEDDEDTEEAPERKKSKKEVMNEIIAKSKLHKYERQQARQEDMAVIDELNKRDNIDALYEDLAKIDESGWTSGKGGSNKSVENATYDRSVRELAFDRRAQPADRTKTEEELQKEAKEKREALEKQRLARMNGELIDEDEISEQEDYENLGDAGEFGLASSLAVPSGQSDDDEDASGQDSEDGSESGEDDEDEDEDEDEGEEAEGSEDDFRDVLDEGAGDGEINFLSARSSTKGAPSSSDIAKTGKSTCPTTVKDLRNIVSGVPMQKFPEVIRQIITSHHARLAEGNKEKLAVLSTVLVDFILDLADEGDAEFGNIIDSLFGILKGLAEDHSEKLARHFRDKLAYFADTLQRMSNGAADKFEPSASFLLFFTIIGMLYSASDHFHPVVTPASLIICQYLASAPVTDVEHVYASVHLCGVMASYQKLSQRYVPEVVLALCRCIYLLTQSRQSSTASSKIFLASGISKNLNIDYDQLSQAEAKKLRLRDCGKVPNSVEDYKCTLLLAAVGTVERVLKLWNGQSAYAEIASPVLNLIEPVRDSNKFIDDAYQKMKRTVKFSVDERSPLTLQSHKPIPIASLLPQFEDNYNPEKKSYDPDRQKQEISKLRAQIKKERKGALRDLRKDSQFVAREKIKSRREQDNAYHEKLKRLERSIATEEGAEKNKYEREKQARKRGRKRN